MTTAFTRTREQLRDMILRKLRKLPVGQTTNSDDEAVVFEALDIYLKQIHRLGIFWRKVGATPTSFTLSSGRTAATAAADVLFPIAMTASNLSMDDPVEIIGIRSYAEIQEKSQTGQPQKAVYNGSGVFTFWPIPINNTTIKLTYEKIIDDTAGNTAPDVDVSMLGWVRDVVAYRLVDDFMIPEQRIVRMRMEYIEAEKNIRALAVQRVDNEVTCYENF